MLNAKLQGVAQHPHDHPSECNALKKGFEVNLIFSSASHGLIEDMRLSFVHQNTINNFLIAGCGASPLSGSPVSSLFELHELAEEEDACKSGWQAIRR